MFMKLKQTASKLFLLILLCQFCIATSFAAMPQITTTLDRHQISDGETFKLTIIIDGEYSSQTTDTSDLEKNFLIVSSMVSPQMTIINGAVSQRTEISLILAPKKTGKLIVPTISLGKFSSTPQTIIVSSGGAKNLSQKNQPVFLDASVDNNNPWVQSQIVYRIRLFYSTDISRGTLTDPTVENAIVMPLGNDKEYQKTVNGTIYQVHERLFAIFPQQSGKLSIQPIVFSGVKNSYTNRQNQFNPFFTDIQVPVRLVSNAISIDVKPIPSEASQYDWLPTKNLTVEENWHFTHQPTRTGDPITRTISIKANGVTASQLPKLQINDLPSHVNAYPDNPKIKSDVTGENIIASSQQNIAYIPSQSGSITLPEITIHWWDINANQLRTTRLPSKTVNLVSSLTQNIAPPGHNQINARSLSETKQAEKIPALQQNFTIWPYVALIILLAWLGTLIFIFRSQLTSKFSTLLRKQNRPINTKQIIHQLKAACSNNDILQTKQSLEAWGKLQWPEKNPMNFGVIAHEVNDEDLRLEISALSAMLYSNQATRWDGNKFWQTFQKYYLKKPIKRRPTSTDLPPLYPS